MMDVFTSMDSIFRCATEHCACHLPFASQKPRALNAHRYPWLYDLRWRPWFTLHRLTDPVPLSNLLSALQCCVKSASTMRPSRGCYGLHRCVRSVEYRGYVQSSGNHSLNGTRARSVVLVVFRGRPQSSLRAHQTRRPLAKAGRLAFSLKPYPQQQPRRL